jgi:1-acyl-sn-glycerol-3-phosphate acyltransferase
MNPHARILHTLLVAFWTVLSALIYSIITGLTSIISQSLSRKIVRSWCIHILYIAGVRIKIYGADNIDKNKCYVFAANHQSNFDIPVLYASLGSDICFIAKKELFDIPFFGWAMKSIGCIKLDRKNARRARESLSTGIAQLKKNNSSLVIFPEGTRSISGKVGEFKRASFTLAIESGAEVIPVAIDGTIKVHKKSTFKVQSADVRVVIGAPIKTNDTNINKEDLAGIVRETVVKNIINI